MEVSTTTKYPVVFIHGVFGHGKQGPLWNHWVPYWPEKHLNELNPNHIIVDIGVVSSDHDRACEAFYQLLGGTVDYGEIHAQETGHMRFGARFAKGLHEQWSETNPVHLVGHSLGATTAIELYQLLCVNFFGVGTNSKWVKSITCIAGPLTGTTLPYLVGLNHGQRMRRGTIAHILNMGLVLWAKLYLCFPWLKGAWDLRMPQWEHRSTRELMSVTGPVNTSMDTAMYGVLPARRIQRNLALMYMDRVHLLSITTSPKTIHVPVQEMLSLAVVMLLGIGRFPRWWPKLARWRGSRAMVITALLVSLWFKVKKLDVSKLPSMYGLMWFMRRRAKSLPMIFDGFDAGNWEHNDGAVNIRSMLRPWFPKPQEMAAETSNDQSCAPPHSTSTTSLQSALSDVPTVEIPVAPLTSSLPRTESHISIDGFHKTDNPADANIALQEQRRFEKGQWYVYRVPSNHLAGTYWDSNAHDLYKSIFTLMVNEYEQKEGGEGKREDVDETTKTHHHHQPLHLPARATFG